jgi:NADH:ubiquinone oxidoreductase subunit D
MILNMGPHHPSTHGVLRFILRTDGEVIHMCRPDVGYLHRGLEKIAEQLPYAHFMPYTDRLDYLAAMNCNLGYAITVEQAADIEVPPRAEYIRVLVAELNRIISHLISVGTFAGSMIYSRSCVAQGLPITTFALAGWPSICLKGFLIG